MTEIRQFLRGLPVFAGDLPTFEPATAPGLPEELFVEWLSEAVAAGVREPHAMTLSTLGADGVLDARVLLLKNVDARGWQFATHRLSPKGRQVCMHPVAALTFYWPEQARQVRVRGRVVAESAQDSAADFLARSPGARAEAVVGRQSQPLLDRQEVGLALKQAVDRISEDPEYVVPEWTLYTVQADEVEFLQADKERKHTRLLYRRGDGWQRHELWP